MRTCTPRTHTHTCTNTRPRTQGGKLGFVEAVRVLFTRYRKQMTVAMVLQIVQQLSGINAINFYSSSIMAYVAMSVCARVLSHSLFVRAR